MSPDDYRRASVFTIIRVRDNLVIPQVLLCRCGDLHPGRPSRRGCCHATCTSGSEVILGDRFNPHSRGSGGSMHPDHPLVRFRRRAVRVGYDLVIPKVSIRRRRGWNRV